MKFLNRQKREFFPTTICFPSESVIKRIYGVQAWGRGMEKRGLLEVRFLFGVMTKFRATWQG
jgi:hypothetical protein